MGKEKWAKPKLIVLVRGGEEAVLQNCKGDGYSTSASGLNSGCDDDDGYGGCASCSAIAAS